MVRIAHISDSHLGSSLFQLIERREDARKCLGKAVDMAMRHSPDILVHTGDLFHSPFPLYDDTNYVVDLLKGLKDKVTVIVLQGNHDVPYGYRHAQSPIWMLENAGLLSSTGESDTRELSVDVDGKKIMMHLISWTRERKFERYLNAMNSTGDNTLLFCHHVPGEYDKLPARYDYVGCGHAHNFRLDEENCVGRPGSTCIVDWKREMGGNRKLIVAEIDSNGIEFTTEKLNDVREFKFHTGLDITGMDSKEANEAMRSWLTSLSPKKKSQPIIIMNVNGVVSPETENGIERTGIIQYGEKRLEPLFLHIEPNWHVADPPPVTLTTPLNVETSLEEYLNYTKFSSIDRVLEELKKVDGGS
ncbi:MAG: metallophosphoesterase family protein [Candidatus Thorarchaeota archaeon]|jgi:DNA repair exonuclease SbcCD nuclease subunit